PKTIQYTLENYFVASQPLTHLRLKELSSNSASIDMDKARCHGTAVPATCNLLAAVFDDSELVRGELGMLVDVELERCLFHRDGVIMGDVLALGLISTISHDFAFQLKELPATAMLAYAHSLVIARPFVDRVMAKRMVRSEYKERRDLTLLDIIHNRQQVTHKQCIEQICGCRG
ncbi:hypothetical protein AeNC1_018391, partial [Aphanomyces euteiches]